MSRHEIQVEIEVLGVTRDVMVEFNFIPGTPARGPSYASGGEPAEGPEVEVLSAKVFKPTFGGTSAVSIGGPDWAKKGTWVDGGDWLTDALQDAVQKGGLDMADFESAYNDERLAAMEARAEMRAAE